MTAAVLILEAHPDLRTVIAEALNRADYRCVAVASAHDALLKLREGEYAFVLVDVDCPTSLGPLYSLAASDPSLMSRLVLISDCEAPAGLPTLPLLLKPFDTRALLSIMKR